MNDCEHQSRIEVHRRLAEAEAQYNDERRGLQKQIAHERQRRVEAERRLAEERRSNAEEQRRSSAEQHRTTAEMLGNTQALQLTEFAERLPVFMEEITELLQPHQDDINTY